MSKIIRSICLFGQDLTPNVPHQLDEIKSKLLAYGFEVQTVRYCSPFHSFQQVEQAYGQQIKNLAVGTLTFDQAKSQLTDFLSTDHVSFNLDLTHGPITDDHTAILFEIIKRKPANTFLFAYTFNNAPSSPFFPSAQYHQNGFSIGLQPTDLSADCTTLDEWFAKMKQTWGEILSLFADDKRFLGIDSSIAPLFTEKGSLVALIRRLGMTFSESVLTDTYIRITQFIKGHNPQPVGLCGLMFPCLEDFELASEYELGHFSIERNLFLSLHSGLGIDTYPIGINENIATVTSMLQLVQALSNKYHKPLSVRFVSDGKARIGDMAAFQNQYLKDVRIRPFTD